MIEEPKPLPQRWITPEGTTINRFDKLPVIVLQLLNWLPVVYEQADPNISSHSLTPVYDEINQQFVYEAILQDISVLLKKSEFRIDKAASFACEKYTSQGTSQGMRYMIKREQAVNFSYDPKPDIANYPMIKREAEESDIAAVELVRIILDTADTWINLAAEIEALRCSGKKKCRKATSVIEIIQIRDDTVLALESI